jgi:hypothetical protein
MPIGRRRLVDKLQYQDDAFAAASPIKPCCGSAEARDR